MVIFLNLDGTAEKVTPQHVYQGSGDVTEITVISPMPATTALQIGFILPDGLYWTSEQDGARYVPMLYVSQNVTDKVNTWTYKLPRSVLEKQGDLYIAFNAVFAPGGNTTSYMCKVIVEESVLPNLPTAPEPSVYELIIRYLAMLNERADDIPNLVASIQKVASNAFTYTTQAGVESAPIVIEGGETAPIPITTASVVTIPENAWQPVYAPNAVTITGYKYIVTAGLHGQMRDGATANDLWVGFDEAADTGYLGAFKRYTVDESGNITVYVNQPVATTVRVWNGKSIVDIDARNLIAQETSRAEAAEQALREQITDETQRAEGEEERLQEQISELQNTGVDLIARQQIAEEKQRAEAAEQALQGQISAETQRAETAEGNLQTQVDDLSEQVQAVENNRVSFNASGWTATASATAYFGAVSKAIEVPSDKRIVQVLDENNQPRGTWRGNTIYANYAFSGVAIIL